MTGAERETHVKSFVGKRIFVGLSNRPDNPTENYALEGVIVDAKYSVVGDTPLTTELWLTDGYYVNLDDMDEKAVFRPGHREQIVLTDAEFDSMIEVPHGKEG